MENYSIKKEQTKSLEGGAALRKVISSLTAPTDKAKDMLDELGISVSNADGSMRSIEDIIWDLNKVLGTTEKQEIVTRLLSSMEYMKLFL